MSSSLPAERSIIQCLGAIALKSLKWRFWWEMLKTRRSSRDSAELSCDGQEKIVHSHNIVYLQLKNRHGILISRTWRTAWACSSWTRKGCGGRCSSCHNPSSAAWRPSRRARPRPSRWKLSSIERFRPFHFIWKFISSKEDFLSSRVTMTGSQLYSTKFEL